MGPLPIGANPSVSTSVPAAVAWVEADLFDASKKEEYGYGIYDQVMTNKDLEHWFNTGDDKRITGKDDIKHHLNELGLNEGEYITVLQNNGGNVILQVKDGRIAIDRQLAMRIQM